MGRIAKRGTEMLNDASAVLKDLNDAERELKDQNRVFEVREEIEKL